MSKTKALKKSTEAPSAVPEVDDKYEVQRMAETLAEAHEIMHDKEKMKKVHKMVGRKAKAVRSFKDLGELRAYANSDRSKEEDDDDMGGL